ncbi:MAG: sensor histidine kinase [Planctomycetota bacterium]
MTTQVVAPSIVGARTPGFLLRYFLVASAIVLTLVTAAVGLVYARFVEAELTHQGEDYAELIAAHLVATIERDPSAIETLTRSLASEDSPADLALLDRVAKNSIEGLGIRRIHVIAPDGRIVYSSLHELVGARLGMGNGAEAHEEREHVKAAFSGERSSDLYPGEAPLDIGGTESEAVLETYLPLRLEGQTVGVIEVYQEAESIFTELRRVATLVTMISALSVLITIGALSLVFIRGQRMIDVRSRELSRSNQALAELTQSLEAQVQKRTLQLVSRERLAALGTLASGVAHEINNPLASIAGAAEGLLRRYKSEDAGGEAADEAADLIEYLQIIRDEAFRAKAITSDLLRSVRADAGEHAPVRVNDLVEDVIGLLRLRGEDAANKIETELQNEPSPIVLGNAAQLRQVIFNVTDNALDAVRGDERVRWSTRADSTGEEVVLECLDEGDGVALDAVKRAFEPFFTTKETGKGTGLGLAICRGIIETHGGTITLSRREERGVRVTIRLPSLSATDSESEA